MAEIRPFRAVRPAAAYADRMAALPYDVYDEKEARRAVKGKPLSFLCIDRGETQLPEGTDPYSPEVYEKAAELEMENSSFVTPNGLDAEGRAKDTRTEAQKISLSALVGELKERFPQALVVGHRELDPGKECPCFEVNKLRKCLEFYKNDLSMHQAYIIEYQRLFILKGTSRILTIERSRKENVRCLHSVAFVYGLVPLFSVFFEISSAMHKTLIGKGFYRICYRTLD